MATFTVNTGTFNVARFRLSEFNNTTVSADPTTVRYVGNGLIHTFTGTFDVAAPVGFEPSSGTIETWTKTSATQAFEVTGLNTSFANFLAFKSANNAQGFFAEAFSGDDEFTGVIGGDGVDFFRGFAGNDSFNGGGGDDVLAGGLGDDTFFVNSAGDRVLENPNEGNDTVGAAFGPINLPDNTEEFLQLGTGNNSLKGTLGNDVLTGNSGNSTIDGFGGNDTVAGGLGNDLLIGGGANDSVLGQDGNDTVLGVDGVDTLDGGAGDDSMDGGGADDSVDGGDGNDTVVGNAGFDTVVGGAGDDSLDGGNNEDLVDAGEGNDTALGGAGNDSVTGGAGDDNVQGGAGVDTVDGGEGNNIIDGGAGADSMVGGGGNDIYLVDDLNDTITDSGGFDTVRTRLTGFVPPAGIEVVEIIGGPAGLNLVGTDGPDTLTGGAGNDVLDGGAGADSMAGLGGNDTYRVDDAGDVVAENGSEGFDTVFSTVDHTLAANTEALTLEDPATNGTGNELNNIINGNALNNSLSGAAGDDSINGFAGNDTIDGGTGVDTMVGGDGDDHYYVDDANDVVTELPGGGTDKVFIDFAVGVFDLPDNVEELEVINVPPGTIVGTAAADTIVGTSGPDSILGLAGDDSLDGGLGNDTIDGGAGNDSIIGFNQKDLLLGGDGNDTLDGGFEIDTLIGGAGNDLLTGGSGTDRFEFDVGFGNDIIADFAVGGGRSVEKIALSTALGVDSFDDLNIAVAGANSVITIGTDTITVNGITNLADFDFLFF